MCTYFWPYILFNERGHFTIFQSISPPASFKEVVREEIDRPGLISNNVETLKINNLVFSFSNNCNWIRVLCCQKQLNCKCAILREHFNSMLFFLNIVYIIFIKILPTNILLCNKVRPSYRSKSYGTRSIIPPCSINGMRGSKKTPCYCLANKNILLCRMNYVCNL